MDKSWNLNPTGKEELNLVMLKMKAFSEFFFIHIFIPVFELTYSKGIDTKNVRVGEDDVEHIITTQKVGGEEDANTCLVASECNGICYRCVCCQQLTVS